MEIIVFCLIFLYLIIIQESVLTTHKIAMINFQSELSKLETVLMKFAFKLTRDREDAKDLYQEMAFRALRNESKFKEGTNLKAWLFTIMRNIFINNYRKKIKRNTILDATDNQYYLNVGNLKVNNGANSNLMMQEFQTIINGLDESIREPFMLHYHGYKYQEIADQLDLPLGTIKSRIFFARKALKQNILNHYKGVLHRIA